MFEHSNWATTMNYSYAQDLADTDRSSVRSSEEAASCSPGDDWKERTRLEQKIESLKIKISRLNVACEADVESFLQMSRDAEKSRGADNPQMARIKQSFEKNNKRNTQDLESLQKKLASYEQRLRDLDTKDTLDTSSRSGNIVSSVGNGIRRTGANIKELTGTVISAPLDIANMIKSSFGSADNITENADVSNVGQSTFYASSDHAAPSSAKKASTLPPGIRMGLDGSLVPVLRSPEKIYKFKPQHSSSNDSMGGSDGAAAAEFIAHREAGASAALLQEVMAELKTTQETNLQLNEQMAKLTEYVQRELKFFEKSLQEDRFKYQKLEDQLNDTIDLHQAEVKVVRQELTSIASRIDYQYNDRFKRVEESVESAHNQMFRMESSLKESMDMRFQGGAWWNAMLLGGANILVEVLKLVLFITAVVLDFFKPFTGTRTKTGVLLFVVVLIAIALQNFDFFGVVASLFSKKKSSTSSSN